MAPASDTPDDKVGATIRSLPFAAFGLSFWWAWVWLAFFSPVLFGESGLANQAYMISVIAVAVSCIAMAFLACATDLVRSNSFIIAMAICFSIGTFLLIAWVDVPTSWAFIIGSILTGIGTGPLIVSWGRYFATLKPGVSAVCIAASFALAAILYFVFNGLPSHLSVSIVALMPVLSAACIVWLLRGNSKEDETADESSDTRPDDINALDSTPEPRSWPTGFLSWRTMVGIAIFAFSSGFIVSLATFTGSAPFDLVGSVQVLANGAMAVVALIVVSVTSFKLELRTSCRIALPIIAVGFLLLSILGDDYTLVGLAIAFFGSSVFELAVWSALARESYTYPVDPLVAFGIGQGGKFIGWTLGSLAVMFTAPVLSQSQSGLLIVVLLVFAATFFLQEKTLDRTATSKGNDGNSPGADTSEAQPGSDADAEQSTANRLAEIAAEYNLTPRETEVCELLAKGRTVPYIEQQLTISHSTAVTHTRHIYEKLGIHDRQELIDLVEGN